MITLVLAVSVGLRVAVAIFLGDSINEVRGGTYDQISYDALALRLTTGHGFSFSEFSWPYARPDEPTAFWSYLYTSLLGAIYLLFGHHPLAARLVQAIIVGVLAPLLTYRVALRCFGYNVAILSAILTSVYAYFVLYAGSLMTEAVYIVSILWLFDVSIRIVDAWINDRGSDNVRPSRLWILSGVELGIAASATMLFRQVIIVFYPLLFIWFVWIAIRTRRVSAATRVFVAAFVAFSLIVLPWGIRNFEQFGRISLPNTNSGFAFYWANHPIYGTHFESVLSPEHGVSYQELIPEELRGLNEAELDKELLRRGIEFVEQDPVRYFLLSMSRIPIFFQFWPTKSSSVLSNSARVLSFGLLLPFIIYGLARTLILLFRYLASGAAFTESPKDSLLVVYNRVLVLLFITSYSFVHLISWANVRYRLPVDAFLVMFAAYAMIDIAVRIGLLQRGKYDSHIVATSLKSAR